MNGIFLGLDSFNFPGRVNSVMVKDPGGAPVSIFSGAGFLVCVLFRMFGFDEGLVHLLSLPGPMLPIPFPGSEQ